MIEIYKISLIFMHNKNDLEIMVEVRPCFLVRRMILACAMRKAWSWHYLVQSKNFQIKCDK